MTPLKGRSPTLHAPRTPTVYCPASTPTRSSRAETDIFFGVLIVEIQIFLVILLTKSIFFELMTNTSSNYIFELPIEVRDYEVDAEGIVNNANYLHYLEHTRHEFCKFAGLTFREMHETGLDPVLSKVTISYKHPLGLGDSMISKLNISNRGPVFYFKQDIFTPEGKPVVESVVEIVCLENGKLSRGERLRQAFAKFL
jgi:acyl-CoA thioester hydrolase